MCALHCYRTEDNPARQTPQPVKDRAWHQPLGRQGNEVFVQEETKQEVVDLLRFFRPSQVQQENACLRLPAGITNTTVHSDGLRETESKIIIVVICNCIVMYLTDKGEHTALYKINKKCI